MTRTTTFSTEETAAAWRKGAAARAKIMAAATETMLARAGVAPGMRVLDVGCGTGDTTFLAAERVGPGGSAVGLDVAAPMISVARETAAQIGARNVELVVGDCCRLAFPGASFDAVIARNSLMFADDLDATARELARVLRPGKRMATTVWSTPAANPYQGVPLALGRALRGAEAKRAAMEVAFATDGKTVAAALARAGFGDLAVEEVAGERPFASLDEAVAAAQDSPVYRELFESLDEPARARAWAEVAAGWRSYVGQDGGVRFPTSLTVVSAAR